MRRRTGQVVDRDNDARVGRGRQTVDKLVAAFAVLVRGGNFRPSLKAIEAASGVPVSTIKNYFPSLDLLGAAVADRHAAVVVSALGLGMVGPTLNKGELHALAYALLVGKRIFNKGESR